MKDLALKGRSARLGTGAILRWLGDHPVSAIVAVGVLICLPVILFGFPNGHDAHLHLIWHQGFAQQLWSGNLYPRWLPDVAWGLGAPVFTFYPPAGFYGSALFAGVLPDDTLGRYALGMAAALAMILSGLTAYLWLKTIAAQRAAAAGAVIYMLVPYHVAVDLYLRTAYAELWAFVWMPLLLYFIRRTMDVPRIGAVGLAVACGGLIATHLPTTLLFAPLAAVYTFHVARGNWRSLAACVGGALAGAALVSVYLVPALLHQDRISAGLFWQEFGFAFSPAEILDRLSGAVPDNKHGSLSFVVLLHVSFLLVLYLIRVSWFARTHGGAGERAEFRFWLIAAAAIFVLVTPLSTFLWDLLPVFKKVQFAWRLHGVLCLAAAAMGALALQSLSQAAPRPREVQIMFRVLAVGAIVIVAGAAAQPLRFDEDETSARIAGSPGVAEFLPRAAADGLTRSGALDSVISGKYQRDWPRLEIAGADAQIREWAAGRLVIDVDAGNGGHMIVRQFFDPAWIALQDGQCCLPLTANPGDARLRLDLPVGRYRIDLSMTPYHMERIGWRVSAATASMLFLLISLPWLFRRRRR